VSAAGVVLSAELAAELSASRFVAPDVQSIERALVEGARLVAGARSVATALGIQDPGDIDLPPATIDADPATVRGAATLYLAAELESARLLPSVETLAGLFMTGATAGDLGLAAEKLRTFWRRRRDRFTAAEREALFGRAFGKSYGPDLALPAAGRNVGFESLLLDLTEALSRVFDDRVFGGLPPVRDVAVRSAAHALASNLGQHARGMATIAATEILTSIADALAIVKEPAVQASMGARTAWGAVAMLTRRYLTQDVDVEAHVARAKTGLAILSWLAEALPRLDVGPIGRVVEPGDPVITSAIQWMQATLRLQDRAPSSGVLRGI